MNRLWVLASCALLAWGGHARANTQRAAAGDLAVVGVTVVPMDREGVLADRTVLVRGDRIALVAPAAEVDTGGATVVEGRGKWLVPGLADMHVHVLAEEDFALFLLNGVTTVRNLFGSPRHLGWREAIRTGTLAGPTLITAGPILDGDPPTWPGSAVVTTAEAARAEVRAQKEAGYDWLKVYSGLSAEAYDAIVAEARLVGMPVAGHVPRAVAVAEAIASGQRSIEHLDGYVPLFTDGQLDDALVAATVERPLWNCPTLIVMTHFARMEDPAQLAGTRGLERVSPLMRETWNPQNDFRLKRFTPEKFAVMRRNNQLRRELVGRLQRAHARLVLGTDTGNPYVIPGFAVLEELRLLVDAGLTPWQALRTATAAAAELQDTPGQFGVVAPGARADLLLIDADPLTDVGALADPPLVIVRGRPHRRDELRAALEKKESADPFAALPALEPEGTRLAAAEYDVLFHGQNVGRDRALLCRAADGTPVIRGQAVIMKATSRYRATRASLHLVGDEVPAGVEVAHEGGKVVARTPGRDPVTLEAAADAVVAPQTIAEFFWYAESLAGLGVGAAQTLTAAEVMTDTGVRIVPARFTFTRQPDQEGRRVYEIVGKNDTLDVTGTITVDADGAPHDVLLTLPFGKVAMQRR